MSANDGDLPDPIEAHVEGMLKELGEDPSRDGLLKTPSRVAKAMRFFTQGYHQDPAEILTGALFDVDYDEMVLVRDIDFYSQCEHHMVPFFGRAHVAYIPNGKVVGLSKVPRTVEIFARRLQVQERLTQQIAQAVQDACEPLGVGVVVECSHMCMCMRGVRAAGSSTVTSAVLGSFRSDFRTRQEFFANISMGARTL